jgi:hypothetical protein
LPIMFCVAAPAFLTLATAAAPVLFLPSSAGRVHLSSVARPGYLKTKTRMLLLNSELKAGAHVHVHAFIY